MEAICQNCDKPQSEHRKRVRPSGDKFYCSATDRTAGKFNPVQSPSKSIKQQVPSPAGKVSDESSDDVTPVRRARKSVRKPAKR